MIGRLIEFSARNALLMLLLIVAIIGGGVWAVYNTPLDALPDLSDVQVIVATDWEDRSPNIIEDQITYPIVTQLLSASKVKAVRATSFYGQSLVYVIFEDGTDLYWARSRVLEYLSGMAGKLPAGVSPQLGPDATGVGWGLEYVLIDKTGKHSLSELRSLQQWQVQYQIRAVPGVAEVASVGGFVKQYQVTVDPDKLLAYKIPINKVVEQVRRGNQEVGGRVLEFTGTEYMVRGRGYFQSPSDIEKVAVGAQSDGTPVLVRDVGFVQIGPDIRRGVVDYNGLGDAAGGIVVVRFGESVYDVLASVKQTIKDTVQPGLPEGVELNLTYDRSTLINHSVQTLREKLIEEGVIVSLVCLVFLFHFRSALVAIITLPLAVLLAMIAMRWIGLTSNIMSLGGIAIAVGAMVDAAIVMIENAHKHIEREEAKPAEQRRPRLELVIVACREVGPSLFFSLLIITVSFLPVFALQDQEGRLFRPLAYTKSFSMLFAAVLSVTVTPFLMVWLVRGKIPAEENNPINRFLIWIYQPVAMLALRLRYVMVGVAVFATVAIIPIYRSLGSEFMPPLWEESVLFMPATLPAASIQTMRQAIQEQDAILLGFPEVASVFAKAGRAESATDPAPLEMVETVINLKPPEQWRNGITPDKLIAEMNAALNAKMKGFSNSWTMPIKARIDMLSTGIRTPLGVKVFGPDLAEIGRILSNVEAAVGTIPGTRSVFAERVAQGHYLDFDIDRDAIARYGLSVMDVQEVIQAAVGGANLTQTIEGRERYPVNVRYGRDLRDDVGKLQRILVATPLGAQVPLQELAKLRFVDGPGLIKSEAAQLVGYAYIDIADRDTGSYMNDARKIVGEMVKLPPGYRLEWSGSFEGMQRASQRLLYVIPITLAVIFLLLYLNARSIAKALIVMIAVPFSLVGAFFLLWLLGYHLSVAVWVGIIALAGVDAETGMVMLLYLDVVYERWKEEGRMRSIHDLESAVMEGAVQRVRPKMMTVLAILMGLLPIMWSSGAGSDVMKRIAAPMVGGVVTSFLLTLLIYPAIYVIWKWWSEVRYRQAAN
ncbi:cation transporter [Rhodopseudomonas sp. AAP120]|uniref:efflux RND transporter permease subunit n=1 Tax=Rhodopseudomonas TaxID=1073 RepID=UPI000164BE9A|nr:MULTISPECIES: CusA/CzcA family heavy metal efflux RND transporter [Rhodopseudomonas]ACE99599.1 heavy metal efflux pump, CzcA family [Rhodopseudomonas palustris TIE-1]KPF96159.1 cation transporter [Rhodopseudomonas sp. AAP120]